MELKRRVGDGVSFILLLLGHIAPVIALHGVTNETGLHLDCTNDYEELMFCQLEGQNCTEYNLTLVENGLLSEKSCRFKLCNRRCCCSIKMMLISGHTHTASVWKEGEKMELKMISIRESMKPKTPKIISVNESNGKFGVMWDTNMKGFVSDSLHAEVTYNIKGDTKKHASDTFKPGTVKGLNYYEILGQDLKPSTTYVVSVRSFTNWSDKFSDSSSGFEFKTPASSYPMHLAITISLSIAAVILSAAIYYCFVKIKTKWLDTVAKYPNPKLPNMHTGEQEVFKPVPPIISSVWIESLLPDDSKPWSKMSLTDTSSGSFQQSSGINTGSSCLSYANTEPIDITAIVQNALCKAFPNISPISPLIINTESNKNSGLVSPPCNPGSFRDDDVSFGSSGFDNKTYFTLIPSCQHQVDSSEVQMQAVIPCDSAYCPSETNMENCPDQQVPACLLPAQQDVLLPPVVSSLVPTDMSYQQCKSDSGSLSYAEDASLSTNSSGTNTARPCDLASEVGAGCESSEVSGATKLNSKSEEATACGQNSFYGSAPAGSSCNFPPVEDDYRPFQSLLGQNDDLSLEQRSGEHEQHSDKYQEDSVINPVVPGFINNAQSVHCLSVLQTPLLSMMSADQSMPIITVSGYQSV
ncbi:uncharacterized protein [Brachyistius frenatus]|uniref:uncharacterized protein n=1 Tax=Brachyistius frenatus TaxID=100188 RepID=UPI0037E71E29